jgi:hypothetical protein
LLNTSMNFLRLGVLRCIPNAVNQPFPLHVPCHWL